MQSLPGVQKRPLLYHSYEFKEKGRKKKKKEAEHH